MAASGSKDCIDEVSAKCWCQQNSFLYILKAYMMVYIITKFRDSSFFQSEVKVDRAASVLPPKNEVKKAYPKNRVKYAIKVTHISEETKYFELLHIKLFVSSGESSKSSFYPISCR